jgi:cytochrome c oxidase assembly protein subunit 11
MRKSVFKLVLAAVIMFGFAFALVPLYNTFCALTGINGKTSGQVEASIADHQIVDENRIITVQFDTNVNSELNWEFKPTVFEMKVVPGKFYHTNFYAKNLTGKDITGQATYSVTPDEASLYFNKTECFCFTRQTLKALEEVLMPVTFIVDTKLTKKIKIMTLSYTFFKVESPKEK